jgi:Fe-S cluster biogenesis protein NfuA
MIIEDKEKLISRINQALDTVRPHLKSDGGDLEIVDVTPEMQVQIRWIGACQNCAMNAMTLRAGIEHTIKVAIPEIQSVKAMN